MRGCDGTGGRRGRGPLLLAGLFLAGLAGCEDVLVDDQRLDIEATGIVAGSAYVDRDGSGTPTAGDEPLEALEVELVPSRGDGVVASAETDEEGVFVMEDVPVGTFRLAVAEGTIPDSLEILGLDEEPFIVAAEETVTVELRSSFPTVPLAEVGALPPDTRVFTSGIALNPRERLGDGVVHLRLDDDYLRAVAVQNVPISAGDSVRFLGRTALEEGLTVLRDVQAFVLGVPVVIPPPVEVRTETAAEADGATAPEGGGLHAALVRVRNAEVVDTATVQTDFVVTIDDGSGRLDLVVREHLVDGFPVSAFDPGDTEVTRAVGLLAPHREDGDLVWRLLPRFPSDVTLVATP